MKKDVNKTAVAAPKSIEELQRLCFELNISLDAIEDVSVLAEPVPFGGFVIPNSLAVHPMEGGDGDTEGRPGELTFRRYKRFARGGAGLIWFEAIAVTAEARSNPSQLWLNEKSRAAFTELVGKVRGTAKTSGFGSAAGEHSPFLVAQLTHSGRYSAPNGTAEPIIAQHEPYRDTLNLQPRPDSKAPKKVPAAQPVVTDEYLDRIKESYVRAAETAFEVGFDAVDIKACHGYLINELLTSRNRTGKYGGSFENRTRFMLDVIDEITNKANKNNAVVTRLGIYDAVPYPYGWGVDRHDYSKPDLAEPQKLINELIKRGVKLINITLGEPHYNPHYNRPFNKAVREGYKSPEHPLVGVHRMIKLAGEIQEKFDASIIVGTGYSWLGAVMPNVAAAIKKNRLAKIIGVGRLALAYPDFAKDIILKGRLDAKKICAACSACSEILSKGGPTGCAVRDSEVYGPVYRRCLLRNKPKK